MPVPGFYASSSSCAAGSMFVPIPSQLLSRVKALLEGHGPEDYLLHGPWGGRQNTANWRNQVWAPALRYAGMKDIEGLVIHSPRYTYPPGHRPART